MFSKACFSTKGFIGVIELEFGTLNASCNFEQLDRDNMPLQSQAISRVQLPEAIVYKKPHQEGCNIPKPY